MKKKPTDKSTPAQSRGGVVEDEKKAVKALYDPKTKLAVASTATIDRMGESITQEGWDLGNYIKNGAPLLWAHNDREILIGNAKNIRVDKSMGDSALVFEPDFHEETDTARAIKTLFEQGRMKTFSVGFMPLETDGNVYLSQELLEISAVNVPANPEAMMLAYRSMRNKGIKREVAEDISGIRKAFDTLFKGAVADELANPDDWEVKSDNMDDVFDIFYAFCDVYFDYETPVEDFQGLLKECVQLLGKVVNGTYSSPGEVTASFRKVLDKNLENANDDDNEVKAPSAAPKRKHHEERIAMAKVLTRAADILNRNEKLPDAERKSVTKVIKRASEIVIEQHKGELNHG